MIRLKGSMIDSPSGFIILILFALFLKMTCVLFDEMFNSEPLKRLTISQSSAPFFPKQDSMWINCRAKANLRNFTACRPLDANQLFEDGFDIEREVDRSQKTLDLSMACLNKDPS